MSSTRDMPLASAPSAKSAPQLASVSAPNPSAQLYVDSLFSSCMSDLQDQHATPATSSQKKTAPPMKTGVVGAGNDAVHKQVSNDYVFGLFNEIATSV